MLTTKVSELDPAATSEWNFDSKKAPISEKSSTNSDDDGQIINGEFVKNHGMHWLIAALFLVGDMAGGGIVALPTAVQQCGFVLGIIICAIMAGVGTASAIFLGKSWAALPRRWSEYRTHCRKPYAELGFRAFGQRTKTAVSICLNVTQFGICVVFLLLSAKNVHDFVAIHTDSAPNVCLMIILVGLVLLPITFLKSPEDFWWAIVAGMCSTAVAVVLIIIGVSKDHEICSPVAEEPKFQILNLFVALGTIVFTFGGHSAFPTIQHDMRRPAEFSRSSVVAFSVICIFYAPVVVMAYLTYGDSLRDSIINSIQTGWIQQAVNMMIAEFGIKRVILRTGMMVAVIFMAESVPSFGPVLNLMGASTVTLTCVIFPSTFYLFIAARDSKWSEEGTDPGPLSLKQVVERTDKRILALTTFIIVVGLVGGCAATFSAIREITDTHFEMPCYVRPFITQKLDDQPKSTNCCGFAQNISVAGHNPDDFCNKPNLHFYA